MDIIDKEHTEVRMIHGFTSRHPLLMIIAQQLVEKIQSLRTHKLFILTVDKTLPALPRMSSHSHRVNQHPLTLYIYKGYLQHCQTEFGVHGNKNCRVFVYFNSKKILVKIERYVM